MASHHHDALWEKLHELEAQLAAYKLVRAAREEAAALGCGDGPGKPGGAACRGRQYDTYVRRRDARREQQQAAAKAQHQQARAARRRMPLSPRALQCAARDKQDAASATPRVAAVAQAKRTPPPALSIPITPRKDTAAALPRSRTENGGGGGVGSPARSHSSHHQRRSSLGALAELGECATPRPFLKRGTGTGGAAAPARRLRTTTRVHDLPAIDVASSTTPRPAPQQEQAPRHARSVSELPLDVVALASPQAVARARKRWGSPERPAAMFSSGGGDLSKGLKKLLSFVRKSGSRGGGGEQPLPFPAPSPRGSGSGKPVSKGWSGCSLVDDVPFDRASLEAHRFPMTRAVGISG